MAERADHHGVRPGVIAGVLAGLVLMVLTVIGAVHLLADRLDTPLAGANAPMDFRIPGPQLESAPQYDRARYFAEKDRLLDRYEWIDRDKGIARIPIDVAMKLVSGSAVPKDATRDPSVQGATR